MLVRHLVLAGCSALALACSSTTGGQDGTRSDDVTNVSQTPAKDQSIGNCWLYATLGWVESLHLAHSGEELNLSESYLTYLAAFTRITTDEFVFDPRGEWNTGDFFGQGAELVTRYGLMDESAFIASEATLDRSARQERANEAIIRALAPGGALDTKEKRRDPRAVRAVLDAAYALPPEIVDVMTKTFGEDLARTRHDGARLPAEGFHDPAKMVVAKLADGHEVTLDEAMGELDPAREVSSVRDRKERRGPYAWRRVELEDPGARDEAVLRLKKTLNAGFAVPIDWYPAFDSMRMPAGSFHAPVRGEGGWHASLAHDYEIELPGGRVLAAGTPVTDAALLRETLAPTSTIKFLRMKNSWGREIGPLGARGYTDAMWDYLMWEFSRARIDYDEKKVEGIALGAVVLPPPSWDGATH
ncbi:MAG: hypothetical protein KC657_13415 [Myxococcales bacterium]|nr:hypothetical protein [Myxococcales bacterium]